MKTPDFGGLSNEWMSSEKNIVEINSGKCRTPLRFLSGDAENF